jgi:hypothetical protein
MQCFDIHGLLAMCLQPARLPSCMGSLNLHGCEGVDDEALSVLSMPCLTTLNLAFTTITNDGLMTLVEVKLDAPQGERKKTGSGYWVLLHA